MADTSLEDQRRYAAAEREKLYGDLYGRRRRRRHFQATLAPLGELCWALWDNALFIILFPTLALSVLLGEIAGTHSPYNAFAATPLVLFVLVQLVLRVTFPRHLAAERAWVKGLPVEVEGYLELLEDHPKDNDDIVLYLEPPSRARNAILEILSRDHGEWCVSEGRYQRKGFEYVKNASPDNNKQLRAWFHLFAERVLPALKAELGTTKVWLFN